MRSSLCTSISLLDHGRFLYRGELTKLLETHSSHKLVRLKFHRAVEPQAHAGLALERTGELTASLKIGSEVALAQLLPQLLSRLPIADIAIESAPLEQVLKSLYAGESTRLLGAA